MSAPSMTDSTFPAGSLNQATAGPLPSRAIPRASVLMFGRSYCSNVTPLDVSESTAVSMLSTAKFRIVKVAGSWFGFG